MATQAFIQKNIQYQNPSSTSTFSEFHGSNSFNFTGTQLLQRSKYFRAQEHNFWAGSRFTSPNGVRSTGLLVGSAKHSILWSSFDLGKHLKTTTYCGHAYTTGTDRPKNVWESPTDLPIIYPTKLKKTMRTSPASRRSRPHPRKDTGKIRRPLAQSSKHTTLQFWTMNLR